MTVFDRGDVVLVEVKFTGSTGSKRRPAVVVSSRAFNAAGTKVVVLALTGNITPPLRPGDTILVDWEAAGLVKPSAARGTIVTVDVAEVGKHLGSLTVSDLSGIDRGLATVLGVGTPSGDA
ncbi:MAG: type II toxin-antitoxin system PemK/MazF family toxin [Armatimonadetes bacterium]|nr:type II toxin-antitoxin system PemK/MazF family toxin [Armatimonadota bacterium]